MDVGRGIVPEKVSEDQLILCRSELIPEKKIHGAIPFGDTQSESGKGSGVREESFGKISMKIKD